MRLLWSTACRQTETEAHYKDVTENGMSAAVSTLMRGNAVSKDKKKKQKPDDKADKERRPRAAPPRP